MVGADFRQRLNRSIEVVEFDVFVAHGVSDCLCRAMSPLRMSVSIEEMQFKGIGPEAEVEVRMLYCTSNRLISLPIILKDETDC